MKKKLAITLTAMLIMTAVPSITFGISNPLKNYDLYKDTHPEGDKELNLSNPERDYVASNSSSQSSNVSREEADKKMAKIQAKIYELQLDKNSTDNQKIEKMKTYLQEAKALLPAYKGEPEYDKMVKAFDVWEKAVNVGANQNMSDRYKMLELEDLQRELITILQDDNVGGPKSSGGERNADLRRSSQQVYANSSVEAGWSKKLQEEFYSNPKLESIKAKYKKGNFTGCMQEAEAYVKKHPNDTLGFYYLAMAYAKSGDKENAVKAYEKVISLHANPMIVKYATNGRNCVLGVSGANCYQNVNVPDYVYPYAKEATVQNLTPIDPETLINKNIVKLQDKLSPATKQTTGKDGKTDGKTPAIKSPFATQDEALDKFINAPYGNGLSPDLNSEIRKQELKHIQEDINREQDSHGINFTNYDKIKEFDKNKQ